MKTLLILIFLQIGSLTAYGKDLKREAIPGEFIIATKDAALTFSLFSNDDVDRITVRADGVQLIKIKSKDSEMIQGLIVQDDILWVAPNYRYIGEAREFVNSDPQYGNQFHHPLMQNLEAWELPHNNKKVIVAVTDDGVDVDHEDLKNSIWINENEIPNNGIDDDQNGFIDDVNGWDFSSGDNNPRPTSSSYAHGTHVAGIIAGELNNDVGIAGSSSNALIMPIRFYGSGEWTSEIIAKSYIYAADNGAKIINTSYNADGFPGDTVVESAISYVYSKGVIHFNSAGNGYASEPKRTQIHELIFVCSTNANGTSNDVKNDFSNYGIGVDICAPGGSILSTTPNNTYQKMSGTSMASPNAAAVAATIWARNPDFTREHVLSRLFNTSDNVDPLNPRYANLLGAGRVNSFRSLTLAQTPPTLRAEMKSGSLTLIVKQILAPESFRRVGTFELYNKENRSSIQITFDGEYMMGTNKITFDVSDIPTGSYEFRAKASLISDPFGNPLDGDADGTGGDDLIFSFSM